MKKQRVDQMDETTKEEGLLPKIKSLFNNKRLSDVQFVFKDKEKSTIFAHQLILALRSDYFADYCSERRDPILRVELQSDMEPLITKFLLFMYTDTVQFNSVQEAKDLLMVAEMFKVKELKSKCSNYLLEESLTLDNLLIKYEYALSKNINPLLNTCREFICSDAEAILSSGSLNNVSVEIMKDILTLENLAIHSEVVVLNAVLTWGRAKCISEKVPVDGSSLKQQIYPFLKHIRFLTLTTTEFHNFLEEYDIFSGSESSKLTSKILQPNVNVNIPQYICDINYKRGTLHMGIPVSEQDVLNKQTSETNNLSGMTKISTESFVVSESRNSSSFHPFNVDELLNQLTSNLSSGSKEKYLVHPKLLSGQGKSENLDNLAMSRHTNMFLQLQKNRTEKASSPESNKSKKYESNVTHRSEPDHQSSNLNMKCTSTSSNSHFSDSAQTAEQYPKLAYNHSKSVDGSKKITYEFKKPSSFTKPNASTFAKRSGTFQSAPNLQLTKIPRHYDFDLSKSQRCLNSSFKRDIKCSIAFTLKSGTLEIFGFELFIQNSDKNVREMINVDVDLRGFSRTSFNGKCELKQNVITIKFPEPVKLTQSKGVLEVSVDDLFADRCQTSSKECLEINSGSNFVCELVLESNQKVENGIIFLISRLSYAS